MTTAAGITLVLMVVAHALTAVALICAAAEIRNRDSVVANLVSRMGFYILSMIVGGGVGFVWGMMST